MNLQPRYTRTCYVDQYGDRRCFDSAWDNWVRWVVLAVFIIVFILFFVLFSCITARRRRRMGRQPFFGTGWATRPAQVAPYYHNGPPAPPYAAAPAVHQNQQYNYELQSPTPAYAAGQQYMPPPGPPPGKQMDGIVR